MKKLILMLLFLTFFTVSYSQVIYLENGKVLVGRIKRLNESHILFQEHIGPFYQPKPYAISDSSISKIIDKNNFELTNYYLKPASMSEERWKIDKRILLLERNANASGICLKDAQNFYYGGLLLSSIGTILLSNDDKKKQRIGIFLNVGGIFCNVYAFYKVGKAGYELRKKNP
ncbi:MAG: hypothetical protein ACTSUC_12120 [Promethearchaeota archaeon]